MLCSASCVSIIAACKIELNQAVVSIPNYPDLNCQSRDEYFKTECGALLNGHRGTQRSTHGTQNKCFHTGTVPVTYHFKRSYKIFIILTTKAPVEFDVQCEEVWLGVTRVYQHLYVCLCVCRKRKLYRPFQHKNTRRNDSEWRQSAHTKGKSKAEIAPALHITCDQAYPVNNTQQLVNIMAYMVYSTLPTSTVRSYRQECPPRLTSRHICDTLCEWVSDWGVVEEEDGVEDDQQTHCEAPHWCVHPKVTNGWRDQPVRERRKMRKGECPRRLGGPAATFSEW